jgi:hypothetical protein
MTPKHLCAAVAALVATLLSGSTRANAQEQPPSSAEPGPHGDYLFPAAGRLSVSLGSGVPFLGVGELAYGFGSRFSAGALVAATPDVGSVRGTTAAGARLRGIVWRSGSWRSVVLAPLLYYPNIAGLGGERDPWVLARPEITLERGFGSGSWVNVGLGAIAAACTESLVTLGREHSPSVMGGVWESARIGGATPLSGSASLFGEASLVLDGVMPARRWIGLVPVVTVVGVEASL